MRGGDRVSERSTTRRTGARSGAVVQPTSSGVSQDFPGPQEHRPAHSGGALGVPSAVSLMGIGKSPSAGKTTAGMGRGRADPFEVVQQPATGGRADEDVMVGEAGRPGIGQNSEPIEEVANGMEARSPLPATPGMHRLPVLSATHTQSSYRQPRHGKRRRSPNGGPHRVGGPPPHDLEDVSRNIGGTPASVAPALDGLWVAIFSVLQECQGGDFPVRALRSEVLGVFSTVSAANAACKDRLRLYIRGDLEASAIEGSSAAPMDWAAGSGPVHDRPHVRGGQAEDDREVGPGAPRGSTEDHQTHGDVPWEEIAYTEFGAISIRAERAFHGPESRIFEAFVERFELDRFEPRDLI